MADFSRDLGPRLRDPPVLWCKVWSGKLHFLEPFPHLFNLPALPHKPSPVGWCSCSQGLTVSPAALALDLQATVALDSKCRPSQPRLLQTPEKKLSEERGTLAISTGMLAGMCDEGRLAQMCTHTHTCAHTHIHI